VQTIVGLRSHWRTGQDLNLSAADRHLRLGWSSSSTPVSISHEPAIAVTVPSRFMPTCALMRDAA